MSFRALTRAHFQLSGGWRQNLVILGAYFILVAVIAAFLYRTSKPAEHAMISAACLSFLSVIQGLLVLFVAPAAIRKAVLRDYQTGMIESHRLTPLSGLDLVLGYLTGPAAQSVLLYGAGLLAGGYFAVDYGAALGFINVVMGGWYFSQFCLLPLGLLVISLVLLTALTTAGKVDLTLVLVVVGLAGGWILVPLVPGLALLFDVMSAGWIIRLLARAGPPAGDPAVLGWAMLLQTALSLILLTAACRKVRAPDRPVFGTYLGLLLLTVTGVTLVIGMELFPGFRWLFHMHETPVWQWLASTVVFVLIAMFPLTAAAMERAHNDRQGQTAASSRLGVDLLPLLLTLMAALVMYCMLPSTLDAQLSAERLRAAGPALLGVALSLWTDYLVVYWARGRGKSVFFVLIVDWAILKALPLAIAAAVLTASEMTYQPETPGWWIAGFSPIGTLLAITRHESPWPGLVFQLLVAAATTAVVWARGGGRPPELAVDQRRDAGATR